MDTLKGLSVLLVEDEYLIALDAEQILKGVGADRVEIVATFDEACSRARDGAFDLAVLDINLNGRPSFPIGEIIQSRGIPLVFASGYDLRSRQHPELGAAPCVVKPYTAARLREAVIAALG
jgi:CheY-like chemotaxis protein